MISLTYLSVATAPLEASGLEELLRVSRERNTASAITGMLLYVDEQFIQTLEGERRAVEATMERIVADPRHHQVDVTLVEELAERQFLDWSMGFKTVSGSVVAELPGFSDFLESGSHAYRNSASLGHAGKFHRAFRDSMPVTR